MARLLRYKFSFWYKSNIAGMKRIDISYPLSKKYTFSYTEPGMWKEVIFVFLIDPIEIQYLQVPPPNDIVEFANVDIGEKELVEMHSQMLEETEVEYDSQESQML